MQICLSALFRWKRIGYRSLSRNRSHGGAPQRGAKGATSSTCSRAQWNFSRIY